MRLAIFPLHLSKALRLPRKKWCRVIRSAAPVTQNHLSKPGDLMLQNATPLGKSAPGPPNNSDEHVSCTAPATEIASLQILFKCPTAAIVFGNATKPSRFAHFWQSAQSLAPATLPSHKSLEKHSVARLSYLFAHLDLLSSEAFSFWVSFFFSSLLFPSLLFPSLLFLFLFLLLLLLLLLYLTLTVTLTLTLDLTLTLTSYFLLLTLTLTFYSYSYSSHLCFSSVHIVGSLTSKLPSVII